MEKQDLDKDSLKIGDYVLLRDIARGNYLSAEGILLDDLVASEDITSLHDCIFCVHLLRQYSASRELNAFLEHIGKEQNSKMDESEQKYLQALERGRDNENKLNDAYMKKKTGQVVLFGDIIQSGKYLVVIPDRLARDERENVRLTLDVHGNQYSALQICPRFKIDREGDRILSNADVYLKVAERQNEFIHTADRDPMPGCEREVNCSLEYTSWRLSIFQSSTDAFDRSILLASQLVYIHDPETKSNLTIAENKTESLDETEAAKPLHTDDESDFKIQSSDTEERSMTSRGFFHDHGDIVLEPIQHDHISSQVLWFLESATVTVGGPIKWKTDQVRFKHMNSGRYLRVETKQILHTDGTVNKEQFFTTTANSEDNGTLFNVNELNSSTKYLGNAKALQVGHNNLWIERGEVLENYGFSYVVKGTKDKTSALSLIVHRYDNNAVKDSEDQVDEDEAPGVEVKTVANNSKEPLDVFVGLSARNYLLKYCEMTEMPEESDSSNTIWPSANRSDLEVFKNVIEKTLLFAQGFSITASDIQVGVDKADPAVRTKRQNLLKEQGTVEIVLRVINKLMPISERFPKKKMTVDDQMLLKMGQLVLGLCFSVLYSAVQDNESNQMYVADFLPVLLAHLSTQTYAVKCVTEMLSKNVELQETKVGTREIQIFVDKLKSSRMNAMYLQLLQACCSCQGKGVDGNQCKVATMLFSGVENDGTIVTLSADSSKAVMRSWDRANGKPSFYLPTSGSESPLRGMDLVTKGIPKLTLTWSNGDDVVHANLEDVFGKPTLFPSKIDGADDGATVGADTMATTPKASKITDPKQALGNYFIAEMFLGAEMCMDRNYVAMHKLDALFPYEVLVSILKTDVNNQVRSAALRLLMCLHVDRDPQATSKIPCLTRTWSDIKKNTEPQLPFVEPNRRFVFGLVQQIISEHLHSMAGTRWDELSRHVLKMLRTMVEFNFYGTTERIRDVIDPLIAALDRRNIEFVAEPTAAPSFGLGTVRGSVSKGMSSKSIRSSMDGGNDHDDDETADSGRKGQHPSTLDLERERSKRTASFSKLSNAVEHLESMAGQLISVALTVAAVAVDVYQIALHDSFTISHPLFFVEIGFLGVFAVELTLRMYCWVMLGKGALTFFADSSNLADLAALIVNLIFLFVSPAIDRGVSFVKCLRFLRIYKLLCGRKAAQVLTTEELDVKIDSFKTAVRYSKAPIFELETMVEAVDILQFMQHVIEDRNITILLRYFYLWESGADRRSPSELFNQAVADSAELTLHTQDFDAVMLDVLMFVHPPLVQSTLEVFMAHHSMRHTLLENAKDVQLLALPKREKQFTTVDQMLRQLEQNAETHELWGELESGADREQNEQTKAILRELIDMCRVRRTVLEFDEEFMADVEIQNLYRNLGCFDICMKVLNLRDSIEEEEDGTLGEVAANTRELCLLCNTLLYWFFLGNAKNQELGYSALDMFLDTLDDEFNSHLVIRAIFKENEALMKLVPHAHLKDLVDRIVVQGKSPHYLALFAAISHVGERNIVENQFEIVKSLTSPGRLQKVSCFFVPIDHPDYQEKRQLMAPFLEADKDLSLDDLPPLLAYHLMFLEVLSGCTVGRMNISTIEAKVQSVFNYVDILQSILDEGTITVAKTRLSKFFYNSIIEVELKIPGLEQSAYVWKLLQSYVKVLGYAKDDLRLVEKVGWASPEVSRQKIEYIIICILITGGFFKNYYEHSTFRFNDTSSVDKVMIAPGQVIELVHELFTKIREVYEMDSPNLSADTKALIFDTMTALNQATPRVLATNLNPIATTFQGARTDGGHMTSEAKLIQKYRTFLDSISADADLMANIDSENLRFIELLESLPSVFDSMSTSDVRYETLARKLVSHIRDNIKIVNNKKRMDARVTKTSTWIIRAFRTMIENKMNMSIFERDEEGGAEEDERAAPVVNALNACGATTLCLDLIADGIDDGLQFEAVCLGVGLLFKEGGALEVQGIMNNHLSKTNSELFFKQIRIIFQKLGEWHEWNSEALKENEDLELPPMLLIVRFLQLMCEGHYLPNQDIMREQPNNFVNYNLLDSFVGYFNFLSQNACPKNTETSIRIAATILEVIQGPCDGNQVHFTLNTELIETLNRINRAKPSEKSVEDDEIELKKTSIDILQGLLEGQGERSPVYERVLSVVHLDIIQMMSRGMGELVTEDGKIVEQKEPSEEQVILQTECVVLLQMLCNFKPALYEELGISRKVEDIVGSGTAMLEIIWRGDIHRRFFHVPKVCDFLAKSSKDALVENVDRTNSENKLIDFLARSHDLYLEAKHQQWLKEKNLHHVFSRENQNRATWTTFTLTVMINILFVVYYDASEGSPEISNSRASNAIDALNLIQTIVAAFVLLQNCVVRTPVIYKSVCSTDVSPLEAVLKTASDAKTMYYFLYLILSILGLTVAKYYLPFLLLDIVAKNATTRDVLNAVVIPRKQLGMTVVLAIFLTYIYSYFIFMYFRGDLGGIYGIGVDPGNQDCWSLFGCFKFVLSYGLRQGGGVGDVMNLTIGMRWLIDTSYFLVVIVMLLNIIFGIIIDTFSSLRADKNERMKDTQQVCFICGIGKQVFDRASDEPDGFKTHIKLDHNMWNYLYFIFMLWEQDKDDDDGLEQYVRRAIDANEIIWFPLNKAIRLDQAATEEEMTLKEIAASIKKTESSLAAKMTNFQTEMNLYLEQISLASKMDFKMGEAKAGIAKFLASQVASEAQVEESSDTMSEVPYFGNIMDKLEDDPNVLDGDSSVEAGKRGDDSSVEDVHKYGEGLGEFDSGDENDPNLAEFRSFDEGDYSNEGMQIQGFEPTGDNSLMDNDFSGENQPEFDVIGAVPVTGGAQYNSLAVEDVEDDDMSNRHAAALIYGGDTNSLQDEPLDSPKSQASKDGVAPLEKARSLKKVVIATDLTQFISPPTSVGPTPIPSTKLPEKPNPRTEEEREPQQEAEDVEQEGAAKQSGSGRGYIIDVQHHDMGQPLEVGHLLDGGSSVVSESSQDIVLEPLFAARSAPLESTVSLNVTQTDSSLPVFENLPTEDLLPFDAPFFGESKQAAAQPEPVWEEPSFHIGQLVTIHVNGTRENGTIVSCNDNGTFDVYCFESGSTVRGVDLQNINQPTEEVRRRYTEEMIEVRRQQAEEQERQRKLEEEVQAAEPPVEPAPAPAAEEEEGTYESRQVMFFAEVPPAQSLADEAKVESNSPAMAQEPERQLSALDESRIVQHAAALAQAFESSMVEIEASNSRSSRPHEAINLALFEADDDDIFSKEEEEAGGKR